MGRQQAWRRIDHIPQDTHRPAEDSLVEECGHASGEPHAAAHHDLAHDLEAHREEEDIRLAWEGPVDHGAEARDLEIRSHRGEMLGFRRSIGSAVYRSIGFEVSGPNATVPYGDPSHMGQEPSSGSHMHLSERCQEDFRDAQKDCCTSPRLPSGWHC